MATKHISKSTRYFFKYKNHAGKHYLYQQGSRCYKYTIFGKFYINNKECFKILGKGNDAFRGGKKGEYIVVEFTPIMNEKWGWYIVKLQEEKEVANSISIIKNASRFLEESLH